jgi:NitT/TauT family transport system permease protein
MRPLCNPCGYPKKTAKGHPCAVARLEPVSSFARWMLGWPFSCCSCGVGGFTLGGFVSPTFLASPVTMVQGRLAAVHRVRLHPRHRHDHVAGAGWLRPGGGHGRAAGHCHGRLQAHRGVLRALREFCRYLPASAFIPLLILWAGIGEAQKAPGHLHRLGSSRSR